MARGFFLYIRSSSEMGHEISFEDKSTDREKSLNLSVLIVESILPLTHNLFLNAKNIITYELSFTRFLIKCPPLINPHFESSSSPISKRHRGGL